MTTSRRILVYNDEHCIPTQRARRYTQVLGDTTIFVIPAGIAGIQKPWMAISKQAQAFPRGIA
jgi:hypothetical protein